MARHRGRTMLSAMRSPNTRTLVAVVLLAGLAGAVATLALDRGKTTERVTTLVRPAPASTTQGDGAEWLPDLARSASAGVVAIQATTTVALPGSPFRPPSSQQAVAYGSGFVLDKQGHILTSDHIVESATKIHVAFADGSKVHAKLLGSDPLLDLAVLSVDVPKATLRPLPLGSADQLQLGDPVIAVGNPFELDRSVSAGIVSALHRAMVAPNGFTVSNAIQTDAAINHGNSGGPLLDAQGKVVGVAAQIADSGVDANVGVAFAVALDQAARRAIGTLEAGRTVRHAWLGVALANIDAILATSDRVAATEGALVTGVVADGPAARAGLSGGSQIATVDGAEYCVGGDIVTAVSGRRVRTASDLETAITARQPGDKLRLTVVRADGSKHAVTVTLASEPTSAPEETTGCQ